MDKTEAVEEYLLTFFLTEEQQNSLDPDDLSNYHPNDVESAFVPDFSK